MSRRFRISQIDMPLAHTREQLFEKACRAASVSPGSVESFQIVKQSVDARKRGAVKYSYVAELCLKPGVKIKKGKNITEVQPVSYCPKVTGELPLNRPLAVIGAGPAGLFCAYLLALNGFRPLVFERGKSVEERQRDVEAFWESGVLDPASNVQFGEGGAGTFSDGKLNTLVKDKYGRSRYVLETFVRFGAPEDILYVNKPHIGTDVLTGVVAAMRKEIIRLGGSFSFTSQVTDLQIADGRLCALTVNGERRQEVEAAVLAVGHSARDTFRQLFRRHVPMEAKAFAVGLRVEHPQKMIDENQYGKETDRKLLPAASYKLTHQTESGRGVYTFCMCPGGYVVNASSEEKHLAVNGMSYRARDGANANSAVIVTVTPEDYGNGTDPLAGIDFQRSLERAAWELGGGRIPQQLFGDFETDRCSAGYGAFVSCTRGETAFANLRHLFSEDLAVSFCEGMHAFGRKIPGFDRADCILSGVESRTSSPVRIVRDEAFESGIKGLYPCGEGAGYAGGIMSAAMDGLKVAEALMKRYRPLVGGTKIQEGNGTWK